LLLAFFRDTDWWLGLVFFVFKHLLSLLDLLHSNKSLFKELLRLLIIEFFKELEQVEQLLDFHASKLFNFL